MHRLSVCRLMPETQTRQYERHTASQQIEYIQKRGSPLFCIEKESDDMDKLIIAAGLLLLAYALWQTVLRIRGRAKNTCCGTAEAVSSVKVEDTDPSHYPCHYRLVIGGMKCSNCARNVENALNSMPGVWARISLAKHEASVLTKLPQTAEQFAQALQKTPYRLLECTADVQGSTDTANT